VIPGEQPENFLALTSAVCNSLELLHIKVDRILKALDYNGFAFPE
jgi:hypothetical protein